MVEHIERILADATDEDWHDRLEELIDEDTWSSVRDHLMRVLEDPTRPAEHWYRAAAIFWGAVLDARPMDDDRVIALVYARLPNDAHSEESNLAWSIASRLRHVGYLSEYDPLADPRVRAQLDTIAR